MLDNQEYNIHQLYSVRSFRKTQVEPNFQKQNYFVSNVLSPKTPSINVQGGGLTQYKMHRSQNNSRQYFPDITNQNKPRTTAQPLKLNSPNRQYRISVEPLSGEEPITIPYLRLNFRLKHGYKKHSEKPEKSSIDADELKQKNKRSLSLFRERQREQVNKVQQQMHEILLRENKQLCVGFEKLEQELLDQLKQK